MASTEGIDWRQRIEELVAEHRIRVPEEQPRIESSTPSLDGELAELSASFENAHPRDVVAWAWERFGDGHGRHRQLRGCRCSLHLVADVARPAEIVLLDTQYLFAETQWFVEQLHQPARPQPRDVVHPRSRRPARRPVADRHRGVLRTSARSSPLAKALAGKAAWVTGVRRADGPTRANAPIV